MDRTREQGDVKEVQKDKLTSSYILRTAVIHSYAAQTVQDLQGLCIRTWYARLLSVQPVDLNMIHQAVSGEILY